MAEYRLVVVGAGGVGKSALTVRFIQGNFVEKYDPTIEDSYRKLVEIDSKACMLDIMDTAGQEEYSALRDQYMKTGEGFVLVYSITSLPSFESCKKLYNSVTRIKEAQDCPNIPIILVANKSDLESQRQVPTEDGKKLAATLNTLFIESSAKNNTNVSEAFFQLVRKIDQWRADHPDETATPTGPKKKKSCVLL
jgi:small GTP-binding protein